MHNEIYIVDPANKVPQALARESFANIGVKERSDLQQWILANPKMLGEELLIVTSEFDRFDKSNNRLDIMALDKQGALVIAELKLDAVRTLADLQAIRYAAFCSTMTMQEVVAQLAKWRGASEENAADVVMSFLSVDEVPEFSSEPRIILAAGAFDDQELTSAVMWLRRFQVDISCVEITPYRLAQLNQIILVPRVIIPLPETREFQVNVERKETAKIQRSRTESGNAALWQAISNEFNAISPQYKASPWHGVYMQVHCNLGKVHYEWLLRRNHIDVCLHAECSDREKSLASIEPVLMRWNELTNDIPLEKRSGPWGSKNAEATLRLPYSSSMPLAEVAAYAAATMMQLMERTFKVLLGNSSDRFEEAPTAL